MVRRHGSADCCRSRDGPPDGLAKYWGQIHSGRLKERWIGIEHGSLARQIAARRLIAGLER